MNDDKLDLHVFPTNKEWMDTVYFKQGGNGSVTALFEPTPPRDSIAMLVAYPEDKWDVMRAAAADRDKLHSTWGEWIEEGKIHVVELEARGTKFVWVPFDVEECQQYCKDRGIPNNSENRLHFARFEHEAELEQDFCPGCYCGGGDEPLRYPEPFETMLELLGEHGNWVVIDALATIAKYNVEDKEVCPGCRVEAAWLNMELSQLIDRHELLFSGTPEPETNHEGSELVQ
jgi:hypothetical protein